jgi:pyruvate dehydrogenase E2 component (dihydrolipoamide acetyltransferase)
VAPPPAPAPPPSASRPAVQPSGSPAAQQGNGGQVVRSSPLARRLASDRGLDISGLQGSGPGGRIIKRDIEAAVSAPPAAGGQPVYRSTGQPDFDDIGLTQIRKTIAKRLSESIGPIPTFYLTADIDLTRVTELRAAMLEMGEEFKVSVNDVLMKAVATALAQHPEVNAHWLGDRIRHHHRVNLGMAVATNDGLIVPVIFDADRKRMSEISAEARELAKRARERKLKPEEYTGSTFSISNLGMFGIDQFTAIINPPEVGILAIGTAHDVIVPTTGGRVDGSTGGREGTFAVQKRLRLTMSCDHRAVDGAVGATFLQTLRRLIENPLMLVF